MSGLIVVPPGYQRVSASLVCTWEQPWGGQFCYVHQHQSKVSLVVFTSLAESTTNGSFLDVNCRGNNSIPWMVRFSMIVLMSASKTWRRIMQQGKGWIWSLCLFQSFSITYFYASKCVREHHCLMLMLITMVFPCNGFFPFVSQKNKNKKKKMLKTSWHYCSQLLILFQ
jgi:hypothetical protein